MMLLSDLLFTLAPNLEVSNYINDMKNLWRELYFGLKILKVSKI